MALLLNTDCQFVLKITKYFHVAEVFLKAFTLLLSVIPSQWPYLRINMPPLHFAVILL